MSGVCSILGRFASIVVLLGIGGCGPQPFHAKDIKPAAAPAPTAAGDWTAFANAGGAQYSPLTQINLKTVGGLKKIWEQHSGDFARGPVGVGTSFEATPIFANDRLYYCTPMNRVFALDPVTGKPLWIFDPLSKQAGAPPIAPPGRRVGVCRGVAYWQDAASPAAGGLAPCAKRIFRADQDARLFAIDADTGRSCRDFGPPKHPGYVSAYDYDNFGKGVAGVTSAPTVIGDVVIVGGVANDAIQDAKDGIVRAFDVRSGALRWQFDPIPEPYRHRTGAANAWAWISADPKNKLVFVPTTSPSTDYYGGARQFDMPLTSAVVALNAETGAVVWHFQTVHHDLWDYDLPNHPLLVTIRKDGKLVDVAIQVTKTGHVFVLDRLTGKPVFPIDETPAPPSPLGDDRASPTQPIPRLDPIAQTQLTRRGLFGVLGLDKLWCQAVFDKSRYSGLFTPPGLDYYIEHPSTLGGGNWGGAAFDPATDTLIVKASNVATRLRLVRKGPGAPPLEHTDFMTRSQDGPYSIDGKWFLSPLGIPCNPPPFGQLSAISMDTGKVAWRIPFGQSHRYGVTAPAFLRWGSPSIGGPIVTGGGLIFAGATLDSRIRAFETQSGREVWRAALPAPGMATPMTFVSHGRQYVVIAAGGSAIAQTAQSDAVVAFALSAPSN